MSAAERNARLDKLRKSTIEWAENRTKQYQDRVAISKAILAGRTGSERLAKGAVQAGSELVASAIDDFLLA